MTASLGYQNPDQMENTLADILGRIISDEPVSPGEGIIHHAEGIDLTPANIELAGLEVTLVNTMSREMILREYLNSMSCFFLICKFLGITPQQFFDLDMPEPSKMNELTEAAKSLPSDSLDLLISMANKLKK